MKPIFGSYDPPAAMLALERIPVYPRSTLINTVERARELAAELGHRPICLLRGHGVVSVGASVEEATLRVMRLEALALMTLRVAQAGGTLKAIPQDEIAELAELAKQDDGSRSGWVWRHYVGLMHERSHLFHGS